MEINLTTLITGVAGTVVGFILKSSYDYFVRKKERQDQYFFALLNKRFEAYQEANYHCEKLKSVPHEVFEKKKEVLDKAREWFNKNCLYLKPELRNKFNNLLFDVDMYNFYLEDFHATRQQKGADHEETNVKRKELQDKWQNIMGKTKNEIQRDLDKYFEMIE